MRTHLLFRGVLAMITLAGCTAESLPVAVTFANICQEDARNRIAVEGYLRLPMLGITCKSGRCVVGQDARVRLTGKVTKSGNSCRIEVDVIEAP